MARMHSGKRGKSSSTRPFRTTPPKWVEVSQDEIFEMVVKLGKKGLSPSRIGVVLRDQYGVPSVKLMTGRRISNILAEKGIKAELPEDMVNLIKKAVELDKHLSENPKDMTAKRGIQLTEAKIIRLARYYTREGRIPADWKYDLKKAKLLVR
jgi:small subunit ribosomal protein S15